jgi:serine/threonine protein kinase
MSEDQKFDPSTDSLLKNVSNQGGDCLLPPCRITGPVGRGGMGIVYRGHHLDFNIDVAVKVLDPILAKENPSLIKRFQQEARSAALINHQNVIRVFTIGESEGLHYIVMEFVEGETTSQRVQRKGPLDIAEALQIVVESTRGLAAAHKAGMVHRDVKPDNILISPEGDVKLADLGLAKSAAAEGGMTHTGAVLGTPRYMPLEQWKSVKTAGPPADVYSMGATLWFLLVGRNAIDGEGTFEILERVSNHEFPDLAIARPDVPAEIVDIVRRSTQKLPEDRYPSAIELLDALETVTLAQKVSLADKGCGSKVATKVLVSPPPKKSPEPATKPTPPPTPAPSPPPVAKEKLQALSVSDLPKATPAPKPAPVQSKAEYIGGLIGFTLIVGGIAYWVWTQFLSSSLGDMFSSGLELGADWTVPDVALEMNWIDAGKFEMGVSSEASSVMSEADYQSRLASARLASVSESGELNDLYELMQLRATPHNVTLADGYWLGVYEVTQKQWIQVMGGNPSEFTNDELNLPVEQISWNDAVEFCNKLSSRERNLGRLLPGYSYTLPSESEWEYALRSGSNYRTSDQEYMKARAWHGMNSLFNTQPVGGLLPNDWGFYDMSGNVAEWCSDWDGPLDRVAVTDPWGADSGSRRSSRGGSYLTPLGTLTRFYSRGAANPNTNSSTIGFRLALTLDY